MTPAALLASLQAAGVDLVPSGDNLRLRAPEGALTADLLGAVKQHKPALLRLLAEKGAAPAPGALSEPSTPACGHDDAIAVLQVRGYGTLCGRCWSRWRVGGMDWPGTSGSTPTETSPSTRRQSPAQPRRETCPEELKT